LLLPFSAYRSFQRLNFSWAEAGGYRTRDMLGKTPEQS
jgi:hypothetical protein